MTDQPNPQPPTKTPAKKAAAAPEEARPVHMLVRTINEDQAELLDFEVFTAEIKARRALDTRGRDWAYVQVTPGTPFTQARSAQQGQLP